MISSEEMKALYLKKTFFFNFPLHLSKREQGTETVDEEVLPSVYIIFTIKYQTYTLNTFWFSLLRLENKDSNGI